MADRLKREILDVEMEVEFQRRVYAGRRRMDRRRLRLVGVRDADSGSYWFYLTNIAPEDLDANDLAQLYACRWQVELVFKELKSHYRFDELPTRKAPVVEALLLASIITLLASRRLLDAVRRRLRRLRHRIPEGRWASLFASAASHILDLILLAARTARALARRLEPMLVHEAVDPNASRLLLLQRVDRGAAWAPKPITNAKRRRPAGACATGCGRSAMLTSFPPRSYPDVAQVCPGRRRSSSLMPRTAT